MTVVTTDVELAAATLSEGGLVAFPTETVYGLGADAANGVAVARVFEAKGRPTGHPLIVHLADGDQLGVWAELDSDGRQQVKALAEAFWPGPLTVIVPRSGRAAAETVGGRDTIGLRVPDHPLTLALLRMFGGGVAGPSANRFGGVSPTTAAHVMNDLDGLIEVVLDGGPATVGVESTIVELVSGRRPVLLRPGGIAVAQLSAVLGVEVDDGRSGLSRAPGMLASHYAPAAAVSVVEASDVAGLEPDPLVGVIAPYLVDHEPSWHLPSDAAGYGRALYASLRAADTAGVERLLVVPPPDGDLLDAVLDRLAKASAPRLG